MINKFLVAGIATVILAGGTALAVGSTHIREGERPAPVKTKGQPFVANVTGESENLRIPAMVTLDSGRIVCAADARYDDGQDGGGLDTVIAYSDDKGENWTSYTANYLGDNGNVFSSKSSAFIDPELVTDGKNIWMLTSFYSGGRNLVDRAGMKAACTGDAFDENGCLLLSDDNGKSYRFKADINSYEDGFTPVTDENGTPTGYRLDEYYNLINSKGRKKGNVFYLASKVKYSVLPTTFLYLTKSTDGGESFGAPRLITLKNAEEYFLGAGPGRGLYAADGTILLSTYTFDVDTHDQNSSFIYSEDDGETWKRADSIPSKEAYGFSGESQLTQLPDGAIRCVFRNKANRICYCDCTKTEAGYKWQDAVVTDFENTSDCMTSVLRVDKNDKTYLLISCPTGRNEKGHNRSDGKIFTFELSGTNEMTLVSEKQINEGFFAYSCLSSCEDKTAFLYEDEPSHITFELIENLLP